MEKLFSVSLIILIVLLSILAAVIIVAPIRYKEFTRKSLSKTIRLHSDKGLAKQGLFWVVILVMSFQFLIYGAFAWKDRNLLLSAEGFIEFLRISGLPIGLLALAVPLTALIAKLHSTAQTARQIKLATSQLELAKVKNNHDLFFLHREKFVSYFHQIGEDVILDVLKVSHKIIPRIHGRLFIGEARNGIPVIDEAKFEELTQKLKQANSCLARVISELGAYHARPVYAEFCAHIYYLVNFFSIRDVGAQLQKNGMSFTYHIGFDAHRQYSVGDTTRYAVAAYLAVSNYMISAADFSGYKKGQEGLKFGGANLEDLMNRNQAKQTIEKILSDPEHAEALNI